MFFTFLKAFHQMWFDNFSSLTSPPKKLSDVPAFMKPNCDYTEFKKLTVVGNAGLSNSI